MFGKLLCVQIEEWSGRLMIHRFSESTSPPPPPFTLGVETTGDERVLLTWVLVFCCWNRSRSREEEASRVDVVACWLVPSGRTRAFWTPRDDAVLASLAPPTLLLEFAGAGEVLGPSSTSRLVLLLSSRRLFLSFVRFPPFQIHDPFPT